jgi:4-amino-4-deoxychorismate lyase
MKTPTLFLETIRLQDGKFHFLSYHQQRMDRTRSHFDKEVLPLILSDYLSVSTKYSHGLYKVRVIYSDTIHEVTYQAYTPRPVSTLRVINADHVEYAFKYLDRSAINALYAQKGESDDILMIKDGLLMDTSYANIILSDGQYWYTPAQPLMMGTCRARLLESGEIIPADIYLDHLHEFKELRLINAMMNAEESPRVSVKNILRA